MRSNKIFTLVIFFVMINSVYAFDLIPSKSTIEPLCQRSTGLFTDIIITDSDEFFSVNVEGDGAKWSTAVPSGFLLKLGEKKTIYTYVTPNRDGSPGNYFVNTVVSTPSETRKVTHSFVVKDCFISSLNFKESFKSACPGDKGVVYELTLRNSGEYRENYELNVKDDVVLSNEVVSLDPGESKTIFAYVDVGENELGNKEFNVFAKTSDDNIIEAGGAVLEVRPCYDFNVFAENSFNICDGDSVASGITVNNLGSVDNVYSFVLDGPGWISLDKNSIEVARGLTGNVNLNINPPYGIEGIFNAFVETIPSRGFNYIKDSYSINVRKCNNVGVDIVKKEELICESESVSYDAVVYNNGEINNNFDIKLEAPAWVDLSEDRINLNAGEKKTVLMNIDDAVVGDYKFKVDVDAADRSVSASDEFNLKVLPLNECYNAELKMSDREVIYFDDSASIPITIKNNGYRTASYELSVSGEGVNFVQLNPSSIDVEAGMSEVVSLYIAPAAQELGEYDVFVNVVVKGGDILDSKKLDLKVTKDKDEVTIGRGFIERYLDNIRNLISNMMNNIRTFINNIKERVKPEAVEEVPEAIKPIEEIPVKPIEEIPVIEEIPEVVLPEEIGEELESLEFVNIANKLMGVGDRFRFNVDNAEHVVELVNLEGRRIVLRFSSDPVDVEFNTGEAKNIDFTSDGYDDLKVVFNGIRNGKADISFEKLPKRRLGLFYNNIKDFILYIIGGIVIAVVLILFIHFKVHKKIIDFFEEDLEEIEEIKEEVKKSKKKKRK